MKLVWCALLTCTSVVANGGLVDVVRQSAVGGGHVTGDSASGLKRSVRSIAENEVEQPLSLMEVVMQRSKLGLPKQVELDSFLHNIEETLIRHKRADTTTPATKKKRKKKKKKVKKRKKKRRKGKRKRRRKKKRRKGKRRKKKRKYRRKKTKRRRTKKKKKETKTVTETKTRPVEKPKPKPTPNRNTGGGGEKKTQPKPTPNRNTGGNYDDDLEKDDYWSEKDWNELDNW